MLRNAAILAGLTAVLAYSTALLGGVARQHQNLYLCALGLLALIATLWRSGVHTPWLHPVYRWLLPLLPAYVAFQLIPLPVSWVAALSPARAPVLSALERIGAGSPRSTLTVFPTLTRDHLLLLCGAIAVFLLVRELAASLPNPWIAVLPLLAIALCEALLGIVQAFFGRDSVAGTYMNRNHFAGLLEMALPFAVAWPLGFFRERRMEGISASDALKTAASWAVAAALLAAILFSQSRMGFLSALFGLFVLAALALFTALRDVIHPAAIWTGIGAVAVLIVIAFTFLPPDQLIRRYSAIATSLADNQSPDTRFERWRDTLPMIRAYPIFGCGLGAYGSAAHLYKTGDPLVTEDRTHNDYLELLSELGIIGASMLLALLAVTLRAAVRRAFTASRPASWTLALGSTASLAALLLHSTADYNLYIPSNMFVFTWVAALATTGARASVRDDRPVDRVAVDAVP